MNYNNIAPFYDNMMRHVNYRLWMTLIQNITSKYFAKTKIKILELGGGTGVLAKKIINNGFVLIGSDYSLAMCKEANKKGLLFLCADARHLCLKINLFDLVIFLYDGINYLKNLEEYTFLFHEVHNCLNSNGFFLFDITTEKNSLTNFFNFIDIDDFKTTSWIRHSYYDQSCKIQHNDFTVYTKIPDKDNIYRKNCEHHIQKIFSVNEVLSSVPRKLFSVAGIWDNFSFNKYDNNSERIHFFLKKI